MALEDLSQVRDVSSALLKPPPLTVQTCDLSGSMI